MNMNLSAERIRAAYLDADEAGMVMPELNAGLPVIADALDIADSSARSEIECSCWAVRHDAHGHWWDTTRPVPDGRDIDEDRDTIAQALRYLEGRGLLLRDPQFAHIVSFRDTTEVPA